jgi:CRP/FNR family transcriptional regulator, cyclic AMP receptor protein
MSKDIQPSSLGLRKIDLLIGLPAQRLDAISRQCAWRHYEAGQRLVAREAEDRDLHMIVAGTVRVTTYSSAGREISFRDLSEGTSYGELSALVKAGVLAKDGGALLVQDFERLQRLAAEASTH